MELGLKTLKGGVKSYIYVYGGVYNSVSGHQEQSRILHLQNIVWGLTNRVMKKNPENIHIRCQIGAKKGIPASQFIPIQ